MHILFCLYYLLIWWTLNKSYCITCSGILPVSVFCVLQGSGVTPLKCGEIYDMDFVANFMENTTMKKLWKSVNICQTYDERMYSGTVFIETRCSSAKMEKSMRMAWREWQGNENTTFPVFRPQQCSKNNSLLFPKLCQVWNRVLLIPATSPVSECVYSIAERTLEKRLPRLSSRTENGLLFSDTTSRVRLAEWGM